MVSRRIAHRQLLIRPSGLINQVFLYCIAVAAARTNVLVHAIVVLGNHVHLVLTDTEAKLPEFCRWLFEFTAKCVNASLGRWENLWSSEPPSVVVLEGPEDALDKMLYVMANPVAAALVGSSNKYPGVVSQPSDFLKGPVEVERPDIFFRNNGPTPSTATLELVPPPGLDDMDVGELAKMLREELTLREADIRRQHSAAGREIMGKKAVLAQDQLSFPSTLEPRRNLCPRIGAKNKWRRIEALRRVASFVEEHAVALERFKKGVMDVVFPPGTYWARVYLGVQCAEAG